MRTPARDTSGVGVLDTGLVDSKTLCGLLIPGPGWDRTKEPGHPNKSLAVRTANCNIPAYLLLAAWARPLLGLRPGGVVLASCAL
jgi:hypothetical protein